MNVALKTTVASARPSLLPLAALILAGWGQAALAQDGGGSSGSTAGGGGPSGTNQATSPYYIGASEGVSRESNLFRAPDSGVGSASKASDTIFTTSVFGGIDQPIGRQRLSVTGNVRRSNYQDNGYLNNTGYGLNANLDWETVNSISGNVRFGANQSLARYGYDTATVGVGFTDKNIETSNELFGRIQYGGRSLLWVDATASHRTLSYSSQAYRTSEYTQNVGTVGVHYAPSPLLNVGVGLRATRTEYPLAGFLTDGTGVSDSASRRDIDLSAAYEYSGQTSFTGRLSYGTSDATPFRSKFSGVTGYADWNYRPTGKVSFVTFLSRDTGTDSAFLNYSQNLTNAIGDQSTTTDSIGTSVSYLATAKISMNGSARYIKRDLSNFGSDGTDNTVFLGLGASYVPTRYLTLGCNVSFERRTASNSSGAINNGSYGYDSNVYGCTASITLR